MSEFFIRYPGFTIVGFIFLLYALTRPFRYWALVEQRKLRSKDIQTHGWPKPPYDADGDLIKKEKNDDQ